MSKKFKTFFLEIFKFFFFSL